ncbi:5784_t:CDS:2 [Cetraspora pellucida]|uniref:5784_t:CDS:1 n=1 Tax=Cetraspora pellucida TaxID=1433469 RepID=A0ACA9KVZ8_9GLOM|nr:5784_t:CDS:2 [Cetraspora pellucida]
MIDFQNIQYSEVLDSIHFPYIQDFSQDVYNASYAQFFHNSDVGNYNVQEPHDDVGNYDVQVPSDDVGNYDVQEPSDDVGNYDIQDLYDHILNTLSLKNNEEVYNEMADLCEVILIRLSLNSSKDISSTEHLPDIT